MKNERTKAFARLAVMATFLISARTGSACCPKADNNAWPPEDAPDYWEGEAP